MKITVNSSLRRLIAIPALLIPLVIITSCGGDDSPSPQELAQDLLEASWSTANGGSIALDGTVLNDRYDGFSVTIADGTFTTTNAGDLFPATGTWEWIGDSDNSVITGNGKEITLNELTSTRAVLSFLKTNQNVAAGIPGNYTITLTR